MLVLALVLALALVLLLVLALVLVLALWIRRRRVGGEEGAWPTLRILIVILLSPTWVF